MSPEKLSSLPPFDIDSYWPQSLKEVFYIEGFDVSECEFEEGVSGRCIASETSQG